MAYDSRMIATALESGIGPRALDTWFPGLSRMPRVLVPIQVDALVVREGGGTWADCKMTPPPPGSDVAGPGQMPTPFANRAEARKKGVYLHWALPDALAAGTGGPGQGEVSFPAIPDRWLIVRLSTEPNATRRAVTAWVLQSGDEHPVAVPLEQWTETEDPERTTTAGYKPLTALGHGDSSWSAYYDNVENRLGFNDTLDGVVDGPLAYLVCGWHSRHIDDPIGEGLNAPFEFKHRLDQLGWEINDADLEAAFTYARRRIEVATDLGLQTREARFSVESDVVKGKSYKLSGVADDPASDFAHGGASQASMFLARAVSWPQLCLYHGAVVGIGWPGVGFGVAPDGLLGGDAGGPPAPDAVKVCVGNTLTEALAVCLADNDGRADEARIVEAVLLGASGELDTPDAAARVDVRLHASGFGSLPGGTTPANLTQHASSPPQSVKADPGKTDPGVFANPTNQKRLIRPDVVLADATASTMAESVAAWQRKIPAAASGTYDKLLETVNNRRYEEMTVRSPAVNATIADQLIPVELANPRYFLAADPVFLLQGAGRSLKHNNDGAGTDSGLLACRLSGGQVTGLAPGVLKEELLFGVVTGADILDGGVDHGGVPPECEDLLRELALLDPGSAAAAAAASSPAHRIESELAASTKVFAVEQVAWWMARDERRDVAPLIARSGFRGTLPSPIAISPPIPPWTPLHLDWEVELFALPDFSEWSLNEIDFSPEAIDLPSADIVPTRTLQGRAILTGGAAQVAAKTVRTVLDQAQHSGSSMALTPGDRLAYYSEAAQQLVMEVTAMRAGPAAAEEFVKMDALAGEARPATATAQNADLDHIADELARMDVLVGALDRFTTQLRDGLVAEDELKPDYAGLAPGQAIPADYWPIRSAVMRVSRLRLVDCFGQYVDLLGSGPKSRADAAKIVRSEPLTVPDRTDLIELPPRFTSPSRLWFRFASASDDLVEAGDAVSPLCGFLLPNHLDGDLQFYGADGTGIGAVRFDAASGVVWEGAPGLPTNVGSAPSRATDNPHLSGIAQGLLDWGAVDAAPGGAAADTALSSLLRIVDTSLWTVDPFGHVGDEHLSLLVGHPLAVMRVLVEVEVADKIDPATVAGVRVPVRIGALAHWQDGLVAYFVDDDYRTLHVPDPSCAAFARPIGPNVGFNQSPTATADYYANFANDLGVEANPGATPIDHPYVDAAGLLWVQPGQRVMLTLLMEPHSSVHATTGYLPRKDIGMRRQWVAPGLSKLAPVFRFGPVLVDPKLIRMPVATDIHGTWSWSHRTDATTWADDPVTNSNADSRIPLDPSDGHEGWLKITPEQPSS